MMPFGILWPTFALVALIFIVWIAMVVARFGHVRRNPPSAADFADGDSALRYFRPVEMPANNLRNLFEMPVLYFALVPLLLMTHHGDHLQVVLAWIFVALRCLHSVIHIRRISSTGMPPRTIVYLLSCLVLFVMWIVFFVDMLHAASLYHQAMGAMG
ncbi:MAG: MAPEG family protein [Sphingomonas sp.]